MKTTSHEEKCQQTLSGLEIWINKLVGMVHEIVVSAEYLDDDHLGFMALCFLVRQTNHIQSIVKLIPNRDSILIARSMVEGLYQLLWAAQEPTKRPLKWRVFAYVHDWRLLQKKIACGELIDPNQQQKNQQ